MIGLVAEKMEEKKRKEKKLYPSRGISIILEPWKEKHTIKWVLSYIRF